MGILDRVKGAWNAFRSDSQVDEFAPAYSSPTYSPSHSSSRSRLGGPFNDKYMITSIMTRISIDAAGVPFHHVKVDDQGRYEDDMDSQLNSCLKLEPNIDQGPRDFRQDIVMTMLTEGCAVVVPVDTTVDPNTNDVVDIYTLRVGRVVTWLPKHVKVNLWNEDKGRREDVTLAKSFVAIVPNPLYSVMNEPNSTLQRLVKKLAQLDAVDEQSSSGKLDIIIQLPYAIKSETRRQQAEKRREDIEFQLRGSQYGIAYADATEKITQLNRPADNNLMDQIEWLATLLYGQLGLTESVMNGTADEATMINYWNRTIEPIVDAIKEAKQRAFLGPVGVRRKQRIFYFKDPFKLVPISALADVADKFTRNEILTSNEFRGFMGIQPSKDPKADQLVNSNMPQSGDNQDLAKFHIDEMARQAAEAAASSNGNGNGNGKQPVVQN